MNRSITHLACWLTAMLFVAPAARAQQNVPHLAYVYPAGGRLGTTFQIKVGGQFLLNATGVSVSGSGITAKIGEYARPMTAMQATQLRERVQELQKQPIDASVQKEIAEIRAKLLLFNNSRLTSPVLAETVTIEIAIAPDADPGEHELRLATPQGLSNPLSFLIDRLPEYSETELLNVGVIPGTNQPQINMPATDMNITLPAVVNGRIKPRPARPQVPLRPGQQFTPGDADWYRFQARKGQQLVVIVYARQLIPYLADAVPGWFQAVVTLFDSKGNELAYQDDYRFHPDPVLHYQIPGDGEYRIEIRDSLYRGREDFIYRIALGELPFVTSIFPLGGQAGSQVPVRLKGWNLPTDRSTMDVKDKGPGIFPLAVRKEDQVSNSVPFSVDTLPEVIEKEPNNSQNKAQPIALPVVVNGRIDQPGDWDLFSFKGRAGDAIVAEVHARRLDTPLDSVLKLTDAKNQQLAYNDDHEDRGSGLNTHHADSLLTAILPADGTYCLHLGDAQRQGGPEHAYRLRISTPRPDFDLRIVPSSLSPAVAGSAPLTVYALRKDGFAGEISLVLKDAPRGFILSGGLIPAQQDKIQLTLTAPPVPLGEPLKLSVEGRAVIRGQETIRPAVPAEDMMQAFAYRHLVPAKELRVVVAKRGGLALARVLGDQPVRIPAGGTARVRVVTPVLKNFEKVQFELSEPPDGISVREFSVDPQGGEIVLQCDAGKIKPGLKGNLIVNVSGERLLPPGGQPPPAVRRRLPLGVLPAIAFEVVNP